LDAAQLLAKHAPETWLSGLALLLLVLGLPPLPAMIRQALAKLAAAPGAGPVVPETPSASDDAPPTQPWLTWLAFASVVGVMVFAVDVSDPFASFAKVAVLTVGALVILAYEPAVDREAPAEFLSAILFALAGSLLLVSADDLITLFLGLELVSLPTYLLVSLGRKHLEAQEAGNKYFFLSVLSAAVLLYGMSFIYGVTGTVRLVPADARVLQAAVNAEAEARGALRAASEAKDPAAVAKAEAELSKAVLAVRAAQDCIPVQVESVVREARASAADGVTAAAAAGAGGERPLGSLPMLIFGAVLVAVGLCFKLAAVPFHFYAPDVYQGAQSAIAGMMAFLPKASGVFAGVKLLVLALMPLAGSALALPQVSETWYQVFWGLAVASMTVGNVVALLQPNIKRMLAYSSIAHSGYLLIGIASAVAAGQSGLMGDGLARNAVAAALFYVPVYGVMTLGAFAVLGGLRTASGEPAETTDDIAGLSRRSPAAALALAVFMFGLTGLPPTAGFFGKLALFGSALSGPVDGTSAGPAATQYWLVALGVLNSAISAYYYLSVVGAAYLKEPVGKLEVTHSRASAFAVAMCALLTVTWGPLSTSDRYLSGKTLADRAVKAARSLPVTVEGRKTVPTLRPAGPAASADRAPASADGGVGVTAAR
jgi:NADH:ubiquinone oxidoreductase subunit 2 (subunit N)